eukprot:GHVQ01015007.1.p1 GENE.GHVQ01015007.1~~GHVQ01015007.1.p1  ORF type:complete len:563 (+),score=61.86 GHVQ01015007.1:52-1740(+)
MQAFLSREAAGTSSSCLLPGLHSPSRLLCGFEAASKCLIECSCSVGANTSTTSSLSRTKVVRWSSHVFAGLGSRSLSCSLPVKGLDSSSFLIRDHNAYLYTSHPPASHTAYSGRNLFDRRTKLPGGRDDSHTCFENRVHQTRNFVNLTGGWMKKEVQYTKYRISKPMTDNSMFDDMYLSDPQRSDFVKFTKETPVFLRFLKLVCDLETRPTAFVNFAKRCEEGLIVEKDVYITKAELVKCIWKNGFTDAEINAFEIAFPLDYKFHYPELAVLFDLSEEDCYKYCIRQRASNPEDLVELKYKKPANLLSSYGLLFLVAWNGLSNQVFSNAWFYTKTLPFGAVFFMLAAYFSREIRAFVTKHSKEAAEQSLFVKQKYDETLYTQMKKYANDARCLEFLSDFKVDVQRQLAKYHEALTEQHQRQLVDCLTQKLISIQQSERAIQGSLQEVMVREVVNVFKESFSRDGKLEADSFAAALELLGQPPDSKQTKVTADPVGTHFSTSLKELQTIDFEKAGSTTEETSKYGPVARRVLQIFQEKEQEFLDQFTVKYVEGHCHLSTPYRA